MKDAEKIPSLSKFNIALEDTCEIFLMVDNREKRNNTDVNYFYDRFCASGLMTEIRTLPLGDFLWIIRIKNEAVDKEEEIEEEVVKITKKGEKVEKIKKKPPGPIYTDYVLDFIIERKTADDLAASIMDGRYEE